MVKIVIGQQPILVAVQRLVHSFLDFLLLQCRLPNAQLIHLALEILRRGVVRKTDVDVLLPVEVGRVFHALDHQLTVYVDELSAEIHANDVCDVVPLAISQVQP